MKHYRALLEASILVSATDEKDALQRAREELIADIRECPEQIIIWEEFDEREAKVA